MAAEHRMSPNPRFGRQNARTALGDERVIAARCAQR